MYTVYGNEIPQMTSFTCSMLIVVRIQKRNKYSDWHQKKKRNVFIVHNLHYATFQLDQKILKHWTHFRFGICWIWFWNIVWIHNRGKNREWVKTKEKRRVAYVLVHTSHIFGFGFNLWMRQMSSSSILGKKIP